MNFFEDTFITILNMSITASYVAITVIIARLLLKKAPKVFSYMLWSILLFRLVCPFSFSTGLSLLGLIFPIQNGISSNRFIPEDIGLMATPAVDVGIESANAAINGSLPSATPISSINPMQALISLGTFIWLTGIILLLIFALVSYLRLKKQIATATLVSDNIYETDLIRSPFVCGFLRPNIYLPLSLSGSERKYILNHERIHIKRFDYLVKPIAFLALVIHWFNPLMWFCYALMTKDMEMSCDERVIRETAKEEITVYSSSLLAMAVRKSIPAPIPLAFGESNVKARINNILNYKKPGTWAITVSVIAVIALVMMLGTNPISEYKTSAYDVDSLVKNKTQYIGNNSKVVALIDGMPLPAGIIRDEVQLVTTRTPYGLIVHYIMTDDSLQISEEQFLKNSVLLFALIENVETIEHLGHWNNMLLSSTPFRFTYTRADAERIVGGDVKQFAESKEHLTELLEVIDVLNAENPKSAFKGLELYVWRNPELTGNNDIYYTLLLGTNRNKTKEEVFDLLVATSNLEKINHEIADYDYTDIFVYHPQSISKEEMSEITDQIKIKNGSIAVGTAWFD